MRLAGEEEYGEVVVCVAAAVEAGVAILGEAGMNNVDAAAKETGDVSDTAGGTETETEGRSGGGVDDGDGRSGNGGSIARLCCDDGSDPNNCVCARR